MHGRTAATSSAKSPSAAVRSRKSQYASVAGAVVVDSSSSALMPHRSANCRCRSISDSSTDCANAEKRRIHSSRGARAAASASRRP